MNDPQEPSRRAVLTGASIAIGAMTLPASGAPSSQRSDVRNDAESIHQEVSFSASRAHIYAALTDAAIFQRVVELSGAVKSGMVSAAVPAKIAREAGGEFSIFGGHITGRIIELVQDVRVVQAWRPADWPAGVYSIARFALQETNSATTLIFDHTGFPPGQAQHLAEGWIANYWEPLARVKLA